MRNPNKQFSPNGQLRIDDALIYTGDWHTITFSADTVFRTLINGSIDVLVRDKLFGKTIKSTEQPLTGRFTTIQLISGVVFANRN